MISKKTLHNDICNLYDLDKNTHKHITNQKEIILTHIDNVAKQLQKQLQCATKGHNFVFEKKNVKPWYLSGECPYSFQFR